MRSATDLGIPGYETIESLDGDRTSVLRATELATGSDVVIKLLDRHKEPILPKRFDRQRKALAKLAKSDLGVVPLIKAGTLRDGQDYVLIPRYANGSLQDQLERGPMPWRQVLKIMTTVAQIVGRLHDEEIVLGDIRPTAILLDDSFEPSISVYGMATRRFDDGTPTFNAPETEGDRAALPTSDVYSLSAISAALIAGRAKGRQEEVASLLDEVVWQVPEHLYEVIEHGLTERPENRHGNGKLMHRALLSIVEDEEWTAPNGNGSTGDKADVDPSALPSLDDIAFGDTSNGDDPAVSINGTTSNGEVTSSNGETPVDDATDRAAFGVHASFDDHSNGNGSSFEPEAEATELPPGLEDILFESDFDPTRTTEIPLATLDGPAGDSGADATELPDLDDILFDSDEQDEEVSVELTSDETSLDSPDELAPVDESAVDESEGPDEAKIETDAGAELAALGEADIEPIDEIDDDTDSFGDNSDAFIEVPLDAEHIEVDAPGVDDLEVDELDVDEREVDELPEVSLAAAGGVVFAEDQTNVFGAEFKPDDEVSPADLPDAVGELESARPSAAMPMAVGLGAEEVEIPFRNVSSVRPAPEASGWAAKLRVGVELAWYQGRRTAASAAAVLGLVAIGAVAIFFLAKEIQTSGGVEADGVPLAPSTSLDETQPSGSDLPFITQAPSTTAHERPKAKTRSRPVVTTVPEDEDGEPVDGEESEDGEDGENGDGDKSGDDENNDDEPGDDGDGDNDDKPDEDPPENPDPPVEEKPRPTQPPKEEKPKPTQPPEEEPATTEEEPKPKPKPTKPPATEPPDDPDPPEEPEDPPEEPEDPPEEPEDPPEEPEDPPTTRRRPRRTTTIAPDDEPDPDELALAAPPRIQSPRVSQLGRTNASVSYSSDQCVATRFVLTGSDGSRQTGSSGGYDPNAQCSGAWQLSFSGSTSLNPDTSYVLSIWVKGRESGLDTSSSISFKTSS